MGNMSYCKMRNTLLDLEDCLNSVEDRDPLSSEERIALKNMIEKMYYFLNDNCLMNEDGFDEEAVDQLISEMEVI